MRGLGHVLPWHVGGHPVLNFRNTRALWDLRAREWGPVPDEGAEWLRSYDHLAEWAGFAGMLDDAAVRRLRRASAAAPSGWTGLSAGPGVISSR